MATVPAQVINWVTNQPIPLTFPNITPTASNSPSSASYTVQSSDYLSQITSASAGGTLTITLPNTLPAGFIVFVSVITNSITLTASGGPTIRVPSGNSSGSGGTSITLSVSNQFQSAAVLFDGTNFWLLTTQGFGQLFDVEFVIDGGGAAILTGVKGSLHIPVAATIANWRIMGDQSGSITIDILRANDAVPSVSMIGAGTKPNLTAQQFAEAAPSAWTSTSIVYNDWLTFNVTAAATVTRVTLCLTCQRV